MSLTVSMPQLGETVTEGTILLWNKKQGDTIREDEVLLEISTDKVDTEVPSPASGTILQILVPEGTTVAVGTPLVIIGEPGEVGGAPAAPAAPAAAPPMPTTPPPPPPPPPPPAPAMSAPIVTAQVIAAAPR